MGKTRKKSKMKKYLSAHAVSALQANDVPKLRQLVESGECLGKSDQHEETLLHIAIRTYNPEAHTERMEAFEYLLSLEGIDKNVPNYMGSTPLMYAFGFSRETPDFAIRLIEAGCELLPTPSGDTFIHLAVRNHWPEVVELLIERGFDVDTQNEERKTALHEAAISEQTDIIWMLLFYGADPNVTFSGTNFLGLTPYLTFFDVIFDDKLLLEQFSKFDKKFSLTTFIEAMCRGDKNFYTLMEIADDINYNYDDLKTFTFEFHQLDSEMLEIFIRECGYIVEDVFQRCCLDDFFSCPDPSRTLDTYINNLFVLLQSDVISSCVEEMNKSPLPLFSYLIGSFRLHQEKVDVLTQILCGFLSQGANMGATAMNEIYSSFGYCDLFKMMLHMNITGSAPAHQPWPTVIYDVRMDIDDVIYSLRHNDATVYKLGKYFTVPALRHLRLPTLVELARNASRKFIVTCFKTKNSMQFYTVLKELKIAKVHREIIAFERPLYS